mmetsp:Transcript_107510/g.302604  ORF Transcript_107510/g.302604 Transcript_107510/m.302604 type:complete len:86 (-) Transcript_107510:648-905(-)
MTEIALVDTVTVPIVRITGMCTRAQVEAMTTAMATDMDTATVTVKNAATHVVPIQRMITVPQPSGASAYGPLCTRPHGRSTGFVS